MCIASMLSAETLKSMKESHDKSQLILESKYKKAQIDMHKKHIKKLKEYQTKAMKDGNLKLANEVESEITKTKDKITKLLPPKKEKVVAKVTSTNVKEYDIKIRYTNSAERAMEITQDPFKLTIKCTEGYHKGKTLIAKWNRRYNGYVADLPDDKTEVFQFVGNQLKITHWINGTGSFYKPQQRASSYSFTKK